MGAQIAATSAKHVAQAITRSQYLEHGHRVFDRFPC
jgi:hypothetical protein